MTIQKYSSDKTGVDSKKSEKTVPNKTRNPSVAKIGDRKMTRIQKIRADFSCLAFHSSLADHPTSLTHASPTSGLAFHSPLWLCRLHIVRWVTIACVLILCRLYIVRSVRIVCVLILCNTISDAPPQHTCLPSCTCLSSNLFLS